MFTEDQVLAAHNQVKTGADFPKYIQTIKDLGLIKYEYWVVDGRTVYFGDAGYILNTGPKYLAIPITSPPTRGDLEHAITQRELGKTDFLTFCKQVADAGAAKWEIDTQKMQCTYFDNEDRVILSETVSPPAP